MIEFALLLLTMYPNQQDAQALRSPIVSKPAGVPLSVQEVEAEKKLSPEDKKCLRAAAERMARCSTGNIRFDRASGLYIPETRKDCN